MSFADATAHGQWWQGLPTEFISRLAGRGVKLVLVARREEKLRELALRLMSRVASGFYKSRVATV